MSEHRKTQSVSQLTNKIWGLHTSAIIETVAFLTAAVLFNTLFGDGKRYQEMSLHPFWIIILLINVRYGLWDGLMATVLSTVFLYAGNLPPQGADESIFDYQYRLALTPVLWLIASLVLGGLRMGAEKEYEDTKRALHHTRKELETITEGYRTLKNIKESLEIRVASQLKTAAGIYTAFKSLESVNPTHILLNVSSVVIPILNPKKFSIWSNGEHGLEPATSHGWKEDDVYARRFPVNHPLYQELMQQRQIISSINAAQEKILGDEGILAAPLIDPETQEIFGMLKIEDIDFIDLNIGNIWAFKNVCESIGYAYANARRFKKIKANTIYSSNPMLFSASLYAFFEKYLTALASKARFSLTLLTLKVAGKQEPAFEGQLTTLLKKTLPPTAVLFKNTEPFESIHILIPTANSEEIQSLMQKLLQDKELSRVNVEVKIRNIISPPSEK